MNYSKAFLDKVDRIEVISEYKRYSIIFHIKRKWWFDRIVINDYPYTYKHQSKSTVADTTFIADVDFIKKYLRKQYTTMFDTAWVSRFEVIERGTGILWDMGDGHEIELADFQDNGNTLKIFIKKRNDE